MALSHQEIIDNFFKAYNKKDFEGIKQVMHENVIWTFLGHNKVAGIKKGIHEVITFFNIMTESMTESRPTVDKLIIAAKNNHMIECQHIKTHREGGVNIEYEV